MVVSLSGVDPDLAPGSAVTEVATGQQNATPENNAVVGGGRESPASDSASIEQRNQSNQHTSTLLLKEDYWGSLSRLPSLSVGDQHRGARSRTSVGMQNFQSILLSEDSAAVKSIQSALGTCHGVSAKDNDAAPRSLVWLKIVCAAVVAAGAIAAVLLSVATPESETVIAVKGAIRDTTSELTMAFKIIVSGRMAAGDSRAATATAADPAITVTVPGEDVRILSGPKNGDKSDPPEIGRGGIQNLRQAGEILLPPLELYNTADSELSMHPFSCWGYLNAFSIWVQNEHCGVQVIHR